MVSLVTLAVVVTVYVLVVGGGYWALRPRLREHVPQSVFQRFAIGYVLATTILGASLTLGLITLLPSGLGRMDGSSLPSPARIQLVVVGAMLGGFLLLGITTWTALRTMTTMTERKGT